jgi:hypothetical protein
VKFTARNASVLTISIIQMLAELTGHTHSSRKISYHLQECDVRRCLSMCHKNIFSLSTTFYPGDGGRTCLRNVGIYLPDYMASYSRRRKVIAKLVAEISFALRHSLVTLLHRDKVART